MGARLFDGDFAGAIHGIQADEIAAVNLRRHRCFVNDARCRARLAHARVFGDRDNARQAQRRVTAQLRIDQMRRNYAGLFAAEAKAL